MCEGRTLRLRHSEGGVYLNSLNNVLGKACYLMAAGSLVTSVVLWNSRRADDPGNAERLGIFIGLWVPTFLEVGKLLEEGNIPLAGAQLKAS